MRRALLSCLAIVFALACGDDITEPTTAGTKPTVTGTTAVTGGPLFATTTTQDGLSISTDKDDYQPGDVVHLTGYGWQPGDVLDIVLTDDPLTHDPHTWTVNVGEDGTFQDGTYVVDEGDLNVAFTLVATSRATGRSLTVNFTDGNPAAPVAGAQSPNPVLAGNTATYLVTVPFGGTDDNCTVTLSAAAGASPAWPTPPSGGFFSFSATTVTGKGGSAPVSPTSTLTVTAPAGMAGNTYRFTVSATPAPQTGEVCQGNSSPRTSALINFVVGANQPPATPGSLAQFRSDGTTSIATGGASNQTSVVLKGSVSDPDVGNTVKLQVEVQPVGTAFTNSATAESGLLAIGSTASVTVSGLANGASYHWQARDVDNTGSASAWVGFGGNAENAADFSVDTDAPGVTVNQAAGQVDPTNTSPINFTVVFTKPVTGFTASDVTITGTAATSTPTVTGGPTTYNVAVPVTADGTVIADIPADAASDAAGNSNVASTSTDHTVTYDNTKPTVTIEQAAGQNDPTNTSPINFTVVFSETVTGFTASDVSLAGTATMGTPVVSGSGPTYIVAVPVSTDGTVNASIAAGGASDAAGNGNTASTSVDNTVTYDHTPPTVTINKATGQADPTKDSPINFTVVFSENVADFADADVGLSGTAEASTANVTGSGTTYNVAVSGMTSDGTVIATIAANVAHDAATNGNQASTSTDNSVFYDKTAPVVTLTCPLVPVLLNDPNAKASWTASDGIGSGIAGGVSSGTIDLDASSVGAKTASVPAGFVQDNVGLPSAGTSCNYSVGYKFAGLDAPVDRPNTMNVSKAGQSIPLKWRLTDYNNAPVLNFTAAALGVAVSGIVCTVNASLDQIEEYAGGSGLQNLGDGYYQYNWKTPGSYANSCRSIGLNLGEGSVRGPLAYFNFKK